MDYLFIYKTQFIDISRIVSEDPGIKDTYPFPAGYSLLHPNYCNS